jgi:DNA repair protein RecO (recombination protein O)
MEIKTQALVLHATKYGESKLIVELLTREMGRLTVICHVSTTGKGKIKKQLFQPLSLLEADIDYRPNRNMQRFRDLRLDTPFISIPYDAVKLSIAFFLTEFLNYATRDEQQNEALFDYVKESLIWLDNKERPYSNFHLVFMMRLSRFIGFYPNVDEETDGNEWFDLRNGEFSPTQPTHPDYLKPEDAAKVKLLMRMNYENMHLFKLSQAERNRCTDIILYYYRLHVPNFPPLRSLEVVKELFR